MNAWQKDMIQRASLVVYFQPRVHLVAAESILDEVARQEQCPIVGVDLLDASADEISQRIDNDVLEFCGSACPPPERLCYVLRLAKDTLDLLDEPLTVMQTSCKFILVAQSAKELADLIYSVPSFSMCMVLKTSHFHSERRLRPLFKRIRAILLDNDDRWMMPTDLSSFKGCDIIITPEQQPQNQRRRFPMSVDVVLGKFVTTPYTN